MDNGDDDNSNNSSLESANLKNCLSLRKAISSKRWGSKKSIQIIIICSLLILVATVIPNFQWSFAILFLQNQGASTLAISIYASCMSIFLLITSIFSQRIRGWMSLKHMLIVCVVLLSGATCLHGLMVQIDDVILTVSLGVAVRAVQGVTATMMQVLALSILIMRFPEKCGRVSAVNESALGLGFSISPFIGGLVYDKVGFLLTFIILGGSGFLMLGPLCVTSYSSMDGRGKDKQYSKINWRDFLFISPLITCSLSVVCETCVDYVMALYVNDVYGEDATLSGLLLSGLSLSSILFSFILGYICDRFNPFLLGVFGSLLSCLGLLAMVPPPFLAGIIPTSKIVLAICGIITGLGQAMIWLHVLPSMLFVKTKCRSNSMNVNERLSNLVALLYIVATSAGEILGSFIAGGLHATCDYWQFFSILSATMFFSLVFTLVCYIRSTASHRIAIPSSDSSDSEDTPGSPALLIDSDIILAV